MKVQMDEKVIYCAATLKDSDEVFFHALKDGIPVATVWNVQVDRLREYWLNKGIAGIVVVRRVVPDLLSRSWLLEDQASGISRRVYTASEVSHFLSNLDHFPVLDRTLLTANTVYLMRASVELHTGEMNDAWWNELMKPAYATMQQEFSLP
nr:DUF4390 domain-containing protein [Mariprofundus sp. NF]